MASCLCDRCAALCCRYIGLPIDNPTTADQFDHIRWYLLHENIVIFIEKRQWYIGILNKCKHLQPDNRCGIYETRPQICRDYSTDNCDYHGGEYDFTELFTSGEQLQAYAEKWLARRAARNTAAKKNGKPNPRSTATARVSLAPIARATTRARNTTVNGAVGNGRSHGAPGNGRSVALPVLGRASS